MHYPVTEVESKCPFTPLYPLYRTKSHFAEHIRFREKSCLQECKILSIFHSCLRTIEFDIRQKSGYGGGALTVKNEVTEGTYFF